MITLEQAKDHLRIDSDVEDAILQVYIDAAEAHVADYLNREVPWQVQETDADGEPVVDENDEPVMVEAPIPAPVIAAALLVLGDLYAHREASLVATNRIDNPAVHRLLNPYRILPGV